MKNKRKKLDSLVESAMPCKVKNLGESDTRRSRCACIVEAHESARKRLEKTPSIDHEDRIAGKEFNLLSHCNLVHKFSPVAPIDEYTGCKSRCGQRVGKL